MYLRSEQGSSDGEPQRVQPATQLVMPYFLRAVAEVREGMEEAAEDGFEEEPPLSVVEDMILSVIKRMMVEDGWRAIAEVLDDINWMRLFVRRCLIAATRNAVDAQRVKKYGEIERN